MRSGDQVLVEAIIRSLPERRRRDETVTVVLAFRHRMTPVIDALAESMRKLAAAARPLNEALAEVQRADAASRRQS